MCFSKKQGQTKRPGKRPVGTCMSCSHSFFNVTEEQMLFFIYNPSSELRVQLRMESRDRKEDRSQKLHLKPCFPTFGLKQEIIYQPPNCHLFTRLYSPTGLPPTPAEVSLDFPLSLGKQLKKTFIWMQKTTCSPFVRLAGSQSDETGFSI